MSRIVWDNTGERFYETGTDRGVLYVMSEGKYGNGVPWNGITAVTQSPSGAEASPLYADNIKYLNLVSAEDFGCTIEAYTYPDEFAECDGSKEIAPGVKIGQQPRKTFGFTHRSVLGNDVDGNDLGYKVHLIYGCLAAPSERAYTSINDSPEAMTFSWEVSTTPVNIEGFKPTAIISIDSTKVDSAKLKALEDLLYGTDEKEATLYDLRLGANVLSSLCQLPISVVGQTTNTGFLSLLSLLDFSILFLVFSSITFLSTSFFISHSLALSVDF